MFNVEVVIMCFFLVAGKVTQTAGPATVNIVLITG